MKVFAVSGFTKSGKTTTITAIIAALVKKGYSVGSIKDIHFEAFSMDTEGKNTYLHRQAGASTVTAKGGKESAVMYYKHMELADLLVHYSEDFVAVEGCKDQAVPQIVTAKTKEELDELINGKTIAISGVISNDMHCEYKGIPIINSQTDVEAIVAIIEQRVGAVLPLKDKECCAKCGGDCNTMCVDILSGNKQRSDCKISDTSVTLTIDGKPIAMVDFVSKILKNNVMAVVKELHGFKKGTIKIEVEV